MSFCQARRTRPSSARSHRQNRCDFNWALLTSSWKERRGLEDGVQDQTRAAEEDEADEGAGAVEAVGPAGDDSDLAIESFGTPVVEPGGHDGNDAINVFADCPRGSLEGLEPGAKCPADPLLQFFADDVDLATAQDVAQARLEQVGSIEATVVSLDHGKPLGLDGRQ